MTASFINGTKIAEDIKREVAAEVQALKGRGIRPGLAVVLVGEDAASSAYVNMKARTCEQLGIYSRKLTIPSSVTTEQLLAEVRKLNEDDAIDGILVQLPLPKQVKSMPSSKVSIRGRMLTDFILPTSVLWCLGMRRSSPARLRE